MTCSFLYIFLEFITHMYASKEWVNQTRIWYIPFIFHSIKFYISFYAIAFNANTVWQYAVTLLMTCKIAYNWHDELAIYLYGCLILFVSFQVNSNDPTWKQHISYGFGQLKFTNSTRIEQFCNIIRQMILFCTLNAYKCGESYMDIPCTLNGRTCG